MLCYRCLRDGHTARECTNQEAPPAERDRRRAEHEQAIASARAARDQPSDSNRNATHNPP